MHRVQRDLRVDRYRAAGSCMALFPHRAYTVLTVPAFTLAVLANISYGTACVVELALQCSFFRRRDWVVDKIYPFVGNWFETKPLLRPAAQT